MLNKQKISIYKGIIQYLLDVTTYPLQNIANLSNAPIHQLEAIYCHNQLPVNVSAELNLINLFTTLIDMEHKGQWSARARQYNR